ncbi:uncharacterized protein LTHEOB_4183 [Lasiodiplodia theobromae]|uniref:uncharacterized protein n=1 Tax=Lasiodiplodia theobromae TaxID=45133 RepID=UPI0015C2F48A|nr:uncharacterized protein LTHEOB_4183 [Lasiodiplodia theobromae]KAF4546186.1 hypothetical protein LTHEOB_4183 [Lasiodiplodia theobromae]
MAWNYIRSFAVVAASAFMLRASAANVQTGEQPQFSLSYLNAHASPPNDPRFRLPPSFSDPPFSPDSWDKVPDYWNYGVWYFVATSSAILADWTNIQWEMTPLSLDNQSAPSVEGQEFFYFELLGVPVKLYGTTWPLAPDSYESTLPGAGAVINNVWEFIAWGYDSKGVPYALLYETQAGPLPPSISLLSRSNSGVAEDTYELLREGLRNLGNADLAQLADDLYHLPHNHNNDGEPFPTCGSTCKLNLLVDLPVNLSSLGL